jgi:membrane protein YqaA with SNARE-associated domain
MTDLMIYAGLFIAALLAASILPLQSEAVLTGLLIAGNQPVVMLVITASVGNIAGSAFNWWLGSSVNRFRDRKWFPVKEGSLSKAENWYRRYGRWSLLLSWVPVIGDPLTMAAGVMREPLWSFLVLVAMAKTVRYIILALVVLGIMG